MVVGKFQAAPRAFRGNQAALKVIIGNKIFGDFQLAAALRGNMDLGECQDAPQAKESYLLEHSFGDCCWK